MACQESTRQATKLPVGSVSHPESPLCQRSIYRFDPKQGCIKIQSDGAGFITTVRADPTLERGRPNLFRKLAKALRDSGDPENETKG